MTALLVPTAALTFLAIRSLRSEAVAQQHLVEETYRQIAEIVGARIDAHLEDLDRELVREFSTIDRESGRGLESTLIAHLRTAERTRPWLNPAFLLHPDGDAFYPRAASRDAGELSLAIGTPDERDSEFGRVYAMAEDAELREGDSRRAATLYTSAVERAASAEDTLRALNGLARSELKSGRHRPALEAYDRVIATASAFAPSQANLALVAHYQRISCLDALENAAGAAEAVVDLFSYLLEQRFVLDADLYAFYRRAVEPTLASGAVAQEHAGRLAELRAREHQFDETARRLEVFRRLLPRLPLRAHAHRAAPGDIQTFAIPGVDDRVVSVAALGVPLRAAAASDTTPARAGGPAGRILLIHEWTATHVVALAAELVEHPRPWPEAGIVLIDPSGGTAFASTGVVPDAVATLSAALGTLPAWRVAAYPATGSLEAIATRGVRRHAALLGFVSLTVMAALVLAAWAVSRELALSRLRSEFVSSVSHELRTPLALIQLFTESLQEGWIDAAARAATYAKIRRETERLTSLINNVLDFSKIEAGTRQYELQAADLGDLVTEVIEGCEPQLAAAEVTVDKNLLQSPVRARIDRDAMRRVVVNLLSNAARYIGKGERTVRVTVFANGTRGGFCVADTGIGMAPAEIERIYDRYYRADDERVRAVAGSGIGLTVVKSIVEAHGGSISVQSAPGAGSTFTVSLPLLAEGTL